MTQEEKAKHYDEVREKIAIRFGSNVADEIFSQFEMSDDERIRKELLALVEWSKSYAASGITANEAKEMIAWLEKQGEQNNNEDADILYRFSFYSYKDEPNVIYLSGFYVNEEYRNKGIGTKILEVADEVTKNLDCHAIRLKTKKDSDAERLYQTHGYNGLSTEGKDEIWLEKQAEQKPVDKVEPKFHEGDWIIRNNKYTGVPVRVIEFKGYYRCDLNGEVVTLTLNDVHNNFHLWTIQDAKDGDVLCTYECDEPKIVFILKGTPKKHYALSYHCYYNIMYPHFELDSKKGCLAPNDEDVKPATKEQRELLFQKMKESGYEWDAEKKVLKEIEQKSAAWSEEDDAMFNFIALILRNHQSDEDFTTFETTFKDCIDWLKSLKDRVQPQPKHEWSEDDEKYLKHAIEDFQKLGDSYLTFWVKSLKNKCITLPIQEWNERDDRILRVCVAAINGIDNFCPENKQELTDWLKSLRPQNRWKPSDEQIIALKQAKTDACGKPYFNALCSLYIKLKG